MRNIILFASLIFAIAASALIAREAGTPAKFPAAQQQQQTAPPQAVPTAPATAPIQPPVHVGPVIVLNPAHGATDTGARGENGIFEKDIVLGFALAARAELQRQGYRVVMTRTDDSNPSYDDRAAIANAFHDFIFVSMHVSSTGTPGTARAYYYQFWNPIVTLATTTGTMPGTTNGAAQNTASNVAKIAPPAPAALSAPARELVRWEEAQRPETETSHRLADILQADLAQHFPGSPAVSSAASVRELRSVTGPAIAVEISSVAVTDPNSLRTLAEPLAVAIAHSISAFHPSSAAGGK